MYGKIVQLDSAVAHWRLESSTAVHTNAIDAALHTAVQSTDAAITVGGQIVIDHLGSVNWKGSSAHIAAEGFSTIGQGASATAVFSIETWCILTGSANQVIMAMPPVNPGAAAFRLFVAQGGNGPTFQWLNSADTQFFMTSTTKIDTTSQAHHVVVVRETATFRLYVDGLEADNEPIDTTQHIMKAHAGLLAIGANVFSTSTGTNAYSTFTYMAGLASDVAIYDVPLSADQVLNHYRIGIGLAVPTTGVVAMVAGAPTVENWFDLFPSVGVVDIVGGTATLNSWYELKPSVCVIDVIGSSPLANNKKWPPLIDVVSTWTDKTDRTTAWSKKADSSTTWSK